MCIIFILALSYIGYSSALGEECQTRGRPGTCQRFSNCSYAIRLVLQNDRPDICEFEGIEPIICCPIQLAIIRTSSEPTLHIDRPITRSPLTDDVPLSIRQCLKYHPKSDFFIAVSGGEKSLPQQFPHMAAVGFDEENAKQWLCGGSLVSKKFVITAAHCLSSIQYGNAKWVRLGDLDLSTTDDDAMPQDFTIIRRISHPDYQPPAKYHDIALLELDRIVSFTLYVSPACLQTTTIINETELTATGWGKTSFLGDASTHLMNVDLKEIDEISCNKLYETTTTRLLPNGITGQMLICAGGDGGKDTCSGDSGGPLQVKNKGMSYSRVEVHTLVGVTSFGKACGLGKTAGVYARISYYVGWLESIIWASEED
ncbi:unnamed protein product [Psylliodes chrysocephalus]|uniref:Uncharacterized protein n=1 Tax=Psylliodes chrysocephalus TaxID=3402493 RepID=A0A9P0G658_9CUCU|nr:unnamed protein product [Psylliodes chrysocephala]